ncbi:transposase [Alteromonas pelagimontana]|uniref:Transposase n=1 Tax=Alteromonas pelagimontana TaxID=1858656 RepID=A0A6M4M9L7_9ALTE|nr:transposase [Alteromonas pelagimontana]QJR79325.1 transposase [Alteromonas pelagimontana]
MANKKRNAEQWQQVIEQQVNSGLTVSEFCTQHKLTAASFYLWRKKLSGTDRSASLKQNEWLAFDMPASASPDTPWQIELALPGGVVLRMNRPA